MNKATLSLADLEVGQKALIAKIHTPDKDTLKKLIAMGLLPDTSITLIRKKPAYLFEIENSRFAVDGDLAKNIFVKLFS